MKGASNLYKLAGKDYKKPKNIKRGNNAYTVKGTVKYCL